MEIENNNEVSFEQMPRPTGFNYLRLLFIIPLIIHLALGLFLSFFAGCGMEGSACKTPYFLFMLFIILIIPVAADILLILSKEKSKLKILAYLSWIIQPIIILWIVLSTISNNK